MGQTGFACSISYTIILRPLLITDGQNHCSFPLLIDERAVTKRRINDITHVAGTTTLFRANTAALYALADPAVHVGGGPRM